MASSLAPSREQAMGASQLQREIDALQTVYVQEQRTLDLLARDYLGYVQDLATKIRPRGCAQPIGSCSAGFGWPAQSPVVWRIENACPPDAARDAGYCLIRHFELPQCPGVLFSLMFHPFGGMSLGEAPEGGLPPCRLTLEVSGAAAEGLHLTVAATLDLESTASSSAGDVRVLSTEWDLVGAGRVHCDGHWPAKSVPAATALVCSAKMTVRSWEAEVVHLDTLLWSSVENAAEVANPGRGSGTTVCPSTVFRPSPRSRGSGGEAEGGG